jgi:hypothetical protein
VYDTSFWTRFFLAALASWRVTHLLAKEDGPADLILRVRKRLGSRWAGRLMDCFYCLSFWIAAPFALYCAAIHWTVSWPGWHFPERLAFWNGPSVNL